jgi:flavorubredoxin
MDRRRIKDKIFSVGAIDWNRRVFDELIHLPEGTSYDSYLIQGSEKTALIDTVYPPKTGELIENLRKLKVNRIDYIVSNHAEQDHSGAIPELLKLYPESKVVCNTKCKEMLIDLLLIPEDRFIVIKDGETLSLGDKTLQFIFAPWVHWPETMFTYIPEDKILFTCDFLGSHFATSELFARDEKKVYLLAKRYYAEVMMPFRVNIRKHLERIKSLSVEFIAPSHGPVYDAPEFIISAQTDWASEDVRNIAIIPYTSMYGSTQKMVSHLVDALTERGVEVRPFDMTGEDAGNLAIALVDAATIVFATPTVLSGAHPNVAYAAFLTNALRPKTKFAGIIGSYSWGGKAVEQIKGILSSVKLEFFEPVLVKGYPREKDFALLSELAQKIKESHIKCNAKD